MNEPITVFAALVIFAIFGSMIVALGLVLWLQMKRLDHSLGHDKPKNARPPALTEDDMRKIQVLITRGVSKTKIAKIFGVSRQTLYTYLDKL